MLLYLTTTPWLPREGSISERPHNKSSSLLADFNFCNKNVINDLSNQSTKILKDNQLTSQFRHWVCRFERKKSWRRIRCCNRCIDLSIFLLLTWRLLNFEKNLQLSLSNNTKTWIWLIQKFRWCFALNFCFQVFIEKPLDQKTTSPTTSALNLFLEFSKFFSLNLSNACWFWIPSRSTMVLFFKNWAPGVFCFKIG